MNEFKRDSGFGDLPHIFDVEWDKEGLMAKIGYVDELCPVCKAHLRKNGIVNVGDV